MSTLEYFYSPRSVYAYFGAPRLNAIAQQQGLSIVHCPVDLSRVVPAYGSVPFADRSAAQRRYQFGRELERWSQWLDMPVHLEPRHHYGDRALPSGLILAAQQLGLDVNTLSEAILTALWRDDRDIGSAEVLNDIAREAGIDVSVALERALSSEIQAAFEACTQRAIALGVPGSPAYRVAGELFYGQDRLMFVERHLAQPFGVHPEREPDA